MTSFGMGVEWATGCISGFLTPESTSVKSVLSLQQWTDEIFLISQYTNVFFSPTQETTTDIRHEKSHSGDVVLWRSVWCFWLVTTSRENSKPSNSQSNTDLWPTSSVWNFTSRNSQVAWREKSYFCALWLEWQQRYKKCPMKLLFLLITLIYVYYKMNRPRPREFGKRPPKRNNQYIFFKTHTFFEQVLQKL